MKKTGLILLSLVLVVAILTTASTSYAQNAFEKSMRKLGRGIVNTTTGWMEIPKQIYTESTDKNIAVGLTYGTAKGVGMGLVRTGAGVIDTVTFPFPINDYSPLLEPEFVFEKK